MIQTESFAISKSKALMLCGPESERYTYIGDVKNQWESSLSSSKILELIGSQNMPEANYPDVVGLLGELSNEEKELSKAYKDFYCDLSRLLSTIPTESDGVDRDLYETLLDLREIRKHTKRPLRVLDIGPGAGRHMAALYMLKEIRPIVYAGVESIGLPYCIQNMSSGLLNIQGRTPQVFDFMDYEFARKPFPEIRNLEEGAIVHLPLWQADHLPEDFFDLIICSYLLDELSAEDMPIIADLIGRCLSSEGIVYCRGSQQRAMFADPYQYAGWGKFHGVDITKTMLDRDLKVLACDVVASQMTRIFVKQGHSLLKDAGGPYIHYDNDVSLMTDLHEDYIKKELRDIIESEKKVLIWGHMDSDYSVFKEYIQPHSQGMSIIGLTHRFAENPSMVLDMQEDSPERMIARKPDVIIIASMRDKSILRQIREFAEPDEYPLVRKFNYPIAFAVRM